MRRYSAHACVLLFTCAVLHAGGRTPQTPADPIAQGYELFYANGPGPALTHFAGVVAARPADLPARFGWLMAAHGRLDSDRAGAVEFEQRLDAFIDAATRYGRDRNDATMRCSTSHRRICYAHMPRFEFDKGTLGAARDRAKAKSYSETYVKAHPDRADAYLALGCTTFRRPRAHALQGAAVHAVPAGRQSRAGSHANRARGRWPDVRTAGPAHPHRKSTPPPKGAPQTRSRPPTGLPRAFR
jgi:hypothetical protein